MSESTCIETLTDVSMLDDLVARDRDHDCEGFGPHHICVKVEAVADRPTRFGHFRIVAFTTIATGKSTSRLQNIGMVVWTSA